MTTAARAQEAEQASVAFQIALTQIGVATVEEALKLWAEVPVTARASTSSSWLKKAITAVMTRRRMSRDLARAYYRLARALRTGTTVADPYHPEPTYVTLDVLRREFASLTGGSEKPQEGRSESAPTKETEPASQPAQTPTEKADEPTDAPADEDSEDAEADRILVEELAGLRADEERIEREAEAELKELLQQLGPNNLAKKQRDIDPEAPAKDVDRLRDEAHAQAGARQAAAAERIAMNGGRSTVWNHAQRDRRALGYIRLSRTGTPCGWCAMLISRGPVYRSEKTAEYGDGDKYHDNCHCYAEPVFSREQYRNSDVYALNRRYEELWPQVTKGLSGKSAISAWRRFIRTEQQAAAQEARRSTTSVQEA
ncbi:head maturation protease [Streptomyces phage Endor2]|uniref:Capsid assembly protease n=1 Tax=Streptomyces phage Endor2 TaxID=2740182 RepID=A0A7G4AX13_9CAUD|nr:head maturation protease [Streptomyces phage Endor2]QMP84553.1 capsid assembly protease [Streptomyces phage Endor2]